MSMVSSSQKFIVVSKCSERKYCAENFKEVKTIETFAEINFVDLKIPDAMMT